MKIANIVLSVLVLLAAAVSAVFSYFLYEKRVTFVTGWEQLTSAIYDTAANLDRNSGTKVAQELTADKLAHKNYDEAAMNSSLGKLRAQSKNIVAQRNALADALKEIASRVNSGAVADINDVNKYADDVRKVTTGVAKTVNNRNRIYRALADKVSGINESELVSGNTDALEPIDALRRAKDAYKRAMSSVASRLGVRLGNEQSISRDTGTIANKINELKREPARLNNLLTDARRDIRSLENSIKAKDATIKSQKVAIADRDAQIKKYKQVLGLAPEDPFTFWTPGSDEARAHMQGAVTNVSKEYGYIVINLGSESVVQQQVGKKVVDVNLGLKKGVELTIVRGDNNEFIAAITLDKVGAKESTADIPLDKVGQIEDGDKVIYKTAK